MAGNLPKDITKLFELRETTQPLYNFLQDVYNRLERAEREIQKLKEQSGGG